MDDHWLKKIIRTIQDFPVPGVSFRDITPVLLEPGALKRASQELVEVCQEVNFDLVAGIESRGFFLAPMIADISGVGVLAVRKEGKLPGETLGIEFDLEYGKDRLEIQKDQVPKNARILVVDDVLATGGTASATANLIKNAGGEVAGLAFLIELKDLGGRRKLAGENIFSLASYS